MKTLEDKLREISLDELNEWTIKKITSSENGTTSSLLYFPIGRQHGKFVSGSHRKKCSDNLKKQRLLALEKKTCPHCNSMISLNNYSRTHGDSCNLLKSGKTIIQFMSDYHNGHTIYRLCKDYGMGKGQVKSILKFNTKKQTL